MLRSGPNHIRTFPDPTPELRAGSRSRIHILGRPQADNTKLRRSAEPSACSLSAAALCLGMNLSFGRSRSSCRLMAVVGASRRSGPSSRCRLPGHTDGYARIRAPISCRSRSSSSGARQGLSCASPPAIWRASASARCLVVTRPTRSPPLFRESKENFANSPPLVWGEGRQGSHPARWGCGWV